MVENPEPGTNLVEGSSASRLCQAPVGLNHVFCHVDSTTYAAVARSNFVREAFAVVEERTTRTAAADNWHGFYLYGESTYVELLQSAEGTGAQVANAGIAYGFERPGQGVELADLLSRELGRPATLKRVDRMLGCEAVPWFQMAWVNRDASSSVCSFGMEYAPEFIARWHGERPPHVKSFEQALQRHVVIERYAAVLGAHGEERLMKDVQVVRLALDDAAAVDLQRELEVMGFRRHDDGPEGIVYLSGDLRIEIRRTLPHRAGGIVGLGLSLRRAVPVPQRIDLGSSQLMLVGDRAWWTFKASLDGIEESSQEAWLR